ncbi:MAG: hypothetical protein HKN19_17720 [Halioglobus sp.]|nr:hypothetical protein [Halioglobus sp.]
MLIAGIPFTMFLAATWLWYYVEQGDLDLVASLGTANQGELVQPPRQIDDVALFDDAGAPRAYADLEPRWTLAVPQAGADCAAACEHLLYLTRQIHVAMGKDFNRIRRVYLSETPMARAGLQLEALSDDNAVPASFAELLETEHRGVHYLQLGPGGYAALFTEQRDAPDTWYLIDPAGWVMMTYNDSIHYKDVISDLKFLLKNSGV